MAIGHYLIGLDLGGNSLPMYEKHVQRCINQYHSHLQIIKYS